jgi:hypothetical protein
MMIFANVVPINNAVIPSFYEVTAASNLLKEFGIETLVTVSKIKQ